MERLAAEGLGEREVSEQKVKKIQNSNCGTLTALVALCSEEGKLLSSEEVSALSQEKCSVLSLASMTARIENCRNTAG